MPCSQTGYILQTGSGTPRRFGTQLNSQSARCRGSRIADSQCLQFRQLYSLGFISRLPQLVLSLPDDNGGLFCSRYFLLFLRRLVKESESHSCFKIYHARTPFSVLPPVIASSCFICVNFLIFVHPLSACPTGTGQAGLAGKGGGNPRLNFLCLRVL